MICRSSDRFSSADKKAAKIGGAGNTEYHGYLGTPSTVFYGYDAKTGITYVLP